MNVLVIVKSSATFARGLLIERAGQDNLSYQELVDDLSAMCQQAKQFILDDDAQHQYFAYVPKFDAHIRQTLQAQSR